MAAGASGFSQRLFLGLLVAAALFIWHSSGGLPERVASHFDGAGRANGFMPRGSYRILMLCFILGLPALVVTVMSSVYRGGRTRLKLPNADWWLAPQRREASVDFLVAHTQWFGCGLVVFLAYVHWLVVQANRLQPPELSSPRMLTALVLFFLGLALWLSSMMRRFRRPQGR